MVDLHGRGTGNVERLPKGTVATLFRAHLAAVAGGEPPSAEGAAAAGAALSLFGLDAWVLAPSKALASTTTAAIRKSATTLAAIAFVSLPAPVLVEVVPVDGDVSPGQLLGLSAACHGQSTGTLPVRPVGSCACVYS